MSDPQVSPIRVAAIGMDQRQRNALVMLFGNHCRNRYILVEEDSSEICIIDLDLFGGERLWQEFRQRHPDRPLILASLKPRQVENGHTLFVKKPIPVIQLMSAIDQLSQILNNRAAEQKIEAAQNAETTPSEPQHPRHSVSSVTQKVASLMTEAQEKVFIGTSPDIDPDNQAQLAKIYYDPQHYLQGHVQQALNQATRYNKNVTIEGPWPAIDMIIAKQQVMVDAGEKHLRPFCTVPDATREVELQFHEQHKSATGRREYSIYAFIWQLALWASRGRLPSGTNLTQPIYLRRWPNFSRLVVTPHALAIAALWTRQPRSLIDTAKSLGIPQRYVFAFYSAANAVQLAGETRRAVDTLLEPPAIKQAENRGLFSKLLSRLRG
ncbi:MAG: hypothetical protein N0E44_17870 [Candidatus Thiodiazotropha lotti]|nr:hypothetical protein [Candidatus Thiodiazotropha lotti]MCW4221751.1 hypothetical protein [Candidatus Thiodiazotropha lotti]